MKSISSLNTSIPPLPDTPPFIQRTVFEIVAGENCTSQIELAITQAAKLTGSRPIIHFAHGTYDLTRPLVVPAYTDIQFVSNARSTILWNNGTTNNFMITLLGPNHATFKDIILYSKGAGCKQLTNADQVGARFYSNALYILELEGYTSTMISF